MCYLHNKASEEMSINIVPLLHLKKKLNQRKLRNLTKVKESLGPESILLWKNEIK